MSYNQRTTCVHYNLAPRLLPMQNNEGVPGYIQNQNIAYMCKGGYSFNGYIENVPTPPLWWICKIPCPLAFFCETKLCICTVHTYSLISQERAHVLLVPFQVFVYSSSKHCPLLHSHVDNIECVRTRKSLSSPATAAMSRPLNSASPTAVSPYMVCNSKYSTFD